MSIAKRCSCVLAMMLCAGQLWAQQQLQVSIQEADRIFLEKNIYLLAANLNIDAQKALEIQSRSYPNPEFSGEVNLRDPQNNRWFHAGPDGEKAFAIEQVILLGGKRKNEIALARQSTRQAELQLEDLLRNLKQQLHTSLYAVYFDEQTLQKYDAQLSVLDTIINNYDVQVQKGNISLKEVVRLKSVYLQLNNSKTELMQDLQEDQKDLQLLLHTDKYVSPTIARDAWERFEFLPTMDSLLTLATTNRADWKMAELNTDIARLNLRYQQSLAIPDLKVGASYDQTGGAFNNQVNLTAGIPLPLWNRNKGNIRSAQVQAKIADESKDIRLTEISAEVKQTWYNMQRSIQEYKRARQLYNNDFNLVFTGMTDNFRKRNISILEFVDFFESYSESLAEINHINKRLTTSAEAVNHAAAANIYQ